MVSSPAPQREPSAKQKPKKKKKEEEKQNGDGSLRRRKEQQSSPQRPQQPAKAATDRPATRGSASTRPEELREEQKHLLVIGLCGAVLLCLALPWLLLPNLAFSSALECQISSPTTLRCEHLTRALQPSLLSWSGRYSHQREVIEIIDVDEQVVVRQSRTKLSLSNFRSRHVFQLVILPPSSSTFKEVLLASDETEQQSHEARHKALRENLKGLLLKAETEPQKDKAESPEDSTTGRRQRGKWQVVDEFELWGWQHREVLGFVGFCSVGFAVLLGLVSTGLSFYYLLSFSPPSSPAKSPSQASRANQPRSGSEEQERNAKKKNKNKKKKKDSLE